MAHRLPHRALRLLALVCASWTILGVLSVPGRAALPGVNGVIVFEREGARASSGILSIDPQTRQKHRLVIGPSAPGSPAWSPDGSLVLRGSSTHFLLVGANADGLREITADTDGCDSVDDPVYSPDATAIAFSGSCGASSPFYDQIYTMSANNGQPKLISAGRPSGNLLRPRWSPDGTRIVFAADTGGCCENSRLSSAIYVTNADGSNLRVVTRRADASDSEPTWSPDGTQIAFSEVKRRSRGIFTVKADGSGVRRITHGHDSSPAWSPDGKSIAFVRIFGRKRSYREGIAVMGANGSNIRRLISGNHLDSRWPDSFRSLDWQRKPAG